ncbi:transposase [Endozoicomonas sp. 8E]|uniref:transposase n=1 Tax=Endozoicomonas sp. 8E TaxID=3035692 RepID=UPI0039775879
MIDFCLSQAQEGEALHTFGHDLKCNAHVHLSITCRGLTDDKKTWKAIFFSRQLLNPIGKNIRMYTNRTF